MVSDDTRDCENERESGNAVAALVRAAMHPLLQCRAGAARGNRRVERRQGELGFEVRKQTL